MFERYALINLDRRTDRLASFQAKVRNFHWGQQVVRYRAVHGDTVTTPVNFRGGGGAWGCKMSHLRILEDAILDGIDTLCVFEDDVVFCADYERRLTEFLDEVPLDWQALMLGGQRMGGMGERMSDNVYRCVSSTRTHAYVLRGVEAMQEVYRVWAQCDTHIDHWNHRWQRSLASYEPESFLCAQDDGYSDIGGAFFGRRYWSQLATDSEERPLTFVQCSLPVYRAARLLGAHSGYSRDQSGANEDRDHGLIKIAEAGWKREALTNWWKMIVAEAQDKDLVPIIWDTSLDESIQEKYPDATWIQAKDVRELCEKFPTLQRAYNCRNILWVIKEASVLTLEGLKYAGFHRGYDCDKVTGIDQGVRKAFLSPNPYDKLPGVVDMLWRQSHQLQCGRPLLAHPSIDVERLRQCVRFPVLELSGSQVHEVLDSFDLHMEKINAEGTLLHPLPKDGQLGGGASRTVVCVPRQRVATGG